MPPRSFQVDVLLTGTAGKIGLCACPGRKFQQLSGLSPDSDLKADLEAIRAFPAAVLITLMEGGELDWAAASLPQLRSAAEEAGLHHIHLPIVDGDIPDIQWERNWEFHGPRLHDELHGGGNIVFHCRGGRGRAGLAAARVLIELGAPPQEAMAKVRQARPGAIETKVQEAYLLRLVTRN